MLIEKRKTTDLKYFLDLSGDRYVGFLSFQEYKTALTLKPDFAEAHNNLGAAYHRNRQAQEAIHAFEQALQIKPGYDAARQALESLLDEKQ